MEDYIRGLITVVALFAICIFTSGFIIYFKNLNNKAPKKHTENKTQKSPQIFYIDNRAPKKAAKSQKQSKKKITIPLEATILKSEDLKKYLSDTD